MTTAAEPTAEAVLRQLKMEIAGHGTTTKGLAERLGVPYDSFRDRVNGTAQMPLNTLIDALAELGVPFDTFARRAIEHLQQQ